MGPFASPELEAAAAAVGAGARPSGARAGVAVLEEEGGSIAAAGGVPKAAATTFAGAMPSPSIEKPNDWVTTIMTHKQRIEPTVLSIPPTIPVGLVPALEELGVILHRFREVPEITQVLAAYGLDYFYSSGTRQRLLNLHLTGKLPAGNLTEFAPMLQRDEFGDDTIKGYFLMNLGSRRVETYAMPVRKTELGAAAETEAGRAAMSFLGTKEPMLCPPAYMSWVLRAIAAGGGPSPIRDINTTCGSLFGILTLASTSPRVHFKTVLNGPAGAMTLGADCIGVSNKEPHLQKIKILREEAERHDPFLFGKLWPVSVAAKAAVGESRKPGVRRRFIEDTADMKQTMLCIYLEIVCRLMDARRVNGKRWFLNAVELQRSLETPGAQWPRK